MIVGQVSQEVLLKRKGRPRKTKEHNSKRVSDENKKYYATNKEEIKEKRIVKRRQVLALRTMHEKVMEGIENSKTKNWFLLVDEISRGNFNFKYVRMNSLINR